MVDDINNIISELKLILPQMQILIQSNNTFSRYILPSIIAGIISIIGVFINNIVSILVFKKQRSLEYGRFYMPYLYYLKEIACEIDLLPEENRKDVFANLIDMVVLEKGKEDGNIGLRKILDSLKRIKNLFELNTYYIINKKINKDVLNIKTLIIYLDKCEQQNMGNELDNIKKDIKNLNLNIKKHIAEIEQNS